ncbi:MAG: DRTGG domain-containing protein [Thermodesulfovibrionia bacterium]|nr:DRTGG domain-containing protein [Thermodesulfovibrionia bacterium]
MKLADLAEELSLKVLTYNEGTDRDVSGCYISDMLSDVMANSKKGDIWITIQAHTNILAVANLKNLSGIIVVNGREVDEETLKRADSEKVTILSSSLSAFEIAGKIYKMIM